MLTHPFLAANRDGAVYDRSCIRQPFGFLEIKCHFVPRNISPSGVHKSTILLHYLSEWAHATEESHAYYAQVHGQMVVAIHGVSLLYTYAREF